MTRWPIDDHRIAAALAAVRRDTALVASDDSAHAADSAHPDDREHGRDHYEQIDEHRLLGEPGPIDELFARAIWSVLVEPGDKVAGALISAVGAVVAAQLVIDRASPETIRDATRGEITADAARDGLLRWTERLRSADVMRSLESAARCGAVMLVPGDPYWPAGAQLLGTGAPVLLWARGDVDLLCRSGVAVVGARAATGYGEHVAMEFAAGLCARDVVVVSGGAYGIDGMAHRAALASGGATVAVLAGGIDRLYPSGHEALLTRVAQQGLLLSEVPCGTPPTKWRFLQRNRLIAAFSAATIVVEAGRRSGALNTANHALEMGLPVGVVPGPITSAASAGCHMSLRADPVECVTSVAEIMQLAFGSDGVLELPEPVQLSADPLQGRVIDALRPRRGQSVAEIARAVGEGTTRIQGVLGVLDLDGHAVLGADGLWRRPSTVPSALLES